MANQINILAGKKSYQYTGKNLYQDGLFLGATLVRFFTKIEAKKAVCTGKVFYKNYIYAIPKLFLKRHHERGEAVGIAQAR